MAKEKLAKKWLYSDTAIRFAKSNQVMRICMNIMEVVLLVLFLLQITMTTSADYLVIGVPTLLYIVGLITNNIIYIKDRSSKTFRYVAVPVYVVAWAWLSIFSPNSYVIMYILPILFCLILYSDAKISVWVSAGPVTGFNEDDYSEEQIFTTESAAITYLHTVFGITGTPSTRSAPSETSSDSGTKGT